VFNVGMAKILDWRRSDDPRDVVHLAVQALVEGHVVAAPTESSYVYLASGLEAGAVDQLLRQAGLWKKNPVSIIPRVPDEVLDLIPSVGSGSRRLVRKAWPGPLVLQSKSQDEYSSLRCLPGNVYDRIRNEQGEVRLWIPDHEVLHYITRLVSGPLVVALAARGDKADELARSVAELPAGASVLSIDGGTIEEAGEPTVVAVEGNRGQVLREGLLSESQLRQLSQYLILFVCTGNTCRSPMAAALMRKKIQDKFQSEFDPQSLPIVVASAGVSAFGGDPASHGALEAIRGYGCSLDQHQSTQLNSRLVEQSDLILAMGQRHRSVIVAQWPEVASKVHLIAADGSEISDPFGGPLDVYQRCAEQLDRHTSYWLDHMDTSSMIHWSKR
jgi:protein-tyrosine-phosphatase/tRNA A37 threonylcarbamoyladenosine synthetase subunit TsaC/SUA5/YrdC